jgi:hypothetical protein
MSRSAGRKVPTRAPQVTPGSPEGREEGVSALQDPAGSPIPGLTGNILNYETVRQPVPVGEPLDQFRGMEAHGVPHEEMSTEEQAVAERGGPGTDKPRTPPQHYEPHLPPVAVPVYLVESQGGGDVYRSATPRHITVANNASDATQVCGRNPRRNRIGLLNEDPTTDIRFSVSPRELVSGGGAILLHAVTTYQWFETQDSLYAVTTSASSTVLLSIIDEFDQEM